MAADRPAPGMRVLLTTDTIGGVWQFTLELATGLLRRGDQVLLAAMGREPDPAQRRQAEEIPGLAWQARPYRLVWMDDPWADLEAAGQWLEGLAARFAPDVVHLNDLALADRDWRAPVLQSAHSCVSSWWQAVHGEPAPANWDRYRACVARSLQAADRVVAPTRAMLDALVRKHGALRDARVIHNGRADWMQAQVAKAPMVLAAGRFWDPAKNLSALAAVAPRLPWPVHVAGEGAGATEGYDGANVHVLGQLPEPALRRWMARASIYALPARYEPFGLSALEAAQCGCALVLGDIPSLREVWADAATYVPPDDHAALEAALLRLIHDDAARLEMAARARRRAARYTAEAMVDGYRDAYAGLLADRAAVLPARAAAGAGA